MKYIMAMLMAMMLSACSAPKLYHSDYADFYCHESLVSMSVARDVTLDYIGDALQIQCLGNVDRHIIIVDTDNVDEHISALETYTNSDTIKGRSLVVSTPSSQGVFDTQWHIERNRQGSLMMWHTNMSSSMGINKTNAKSMLKVLVDFKANPYE